MKHIKFKPDISEWEIDAITEVTEIIQDGLLKAVSEALQSAFEDDETYIYFPIEWINEPGAERTGTDGIGGKPVTDPLTVYLRVGIEGGVDREKPTFEFNLRESLADSIDNCAEDGSFSAGLGRLSESLRALADEIDAARAKSNAEPTGRGPDAEQ